MPKGELKFLCDDKKASPSIGVPVYVKDDARKKSKPKLAKGNRGGTIIEDLSFVDVEGNFYYVFKVRHATGDYVWGREELVEIGGLALPDVDWTLTEEENH